MENLVEEKYYDLILNLVRQHRRYESCKTIENDIVDDVLKRLQPVLKDIHDEAIIESYLQKLVSNSIITMSHKNNIPRRNISKPALFDNIVNQEKPVEVTQKQEEHLELENEPNEPNEPNELNESVLDLTEDNLEENSEILEKVEESIEVPQSEESIQPEEAFSEEDLSDGLSEEELILDEISDNVVEQNTNEEEGSFDEEVILQEQDLSDSNNVESLNEASNDTIENKIDNLVENEQNEFSLDFLENKDNNENSDELFESSNEINSDLDLGSVDDLILDFNDGNADEIKNAEEPEEVSYSDIFEVDNNEEVNILPKEIPSKSINYDCFDIKLAHEDFLINDKDAIIADIINVNKSHPELNLIEIFKLKYNEHKTVKEIAQELNMSEDDVIIGINKLIDISKG